MQFEDSHAAEELVPENGSGPVDPFEEALQTIRKTLSVAFKAEQLTRAGPAVTREAGRLAREYYFRYNQEALSRGRPSLRMDEAVFIQRALAELLGMGVLESLLHEPGIEDIAVNGPEEVFLFRDGGWTRTDIHFASASRLLEILNRGMAHVQRKANMVSPIADAVLRTGERISVVTYPVASPFPAAVIRIPGAQTIELEDLVSQELTPAAPPPAPVPGGDSPVDEACATMLSPRAAAYLQAAVRCGLNIAAVGPTGSGKTTLLMALGRKIPENRRILIIEDTPEINLHPGDPQPHNVLYLRTRPASLEGLPAISQADLVRLALRQRPDALTLGEARGAEVFDLLNALNTGHKNGLTSLHAYGVEEVFDRIYLMLAQSDRGRFLDAARAARLVASTLHILVSLEMTGSTRYVRTIAELTGQVQHRGTSYEPELRKLFHRETPWSALAGPVTRSAFHARFRKAGFPEHDFLNPSSVAVQLPGGTS